MRLTEGSEFSEYAEQDPTYKHENRANHDDVDLYVPVHEGSPAKPSPNENLRKKCGHTLIKL